MEVLIQIDFTPCAVAPPLGYNVLWRIQASGSESENSYIDVGNYFVSPIIIMVEVEPGDIVEGILRSKLSEEEFCDPVPWQYEIPYTCCSPAVTEAITLSDSDSL